MSTVKRVSGDYTVQTINVGDLVTLESTNVNIVGNLTVTGNAVLTGNINADKIFNGTTSVEIPVINGNITFNPGGVSNIMVISPTGTSFAGAVAFSGNVDAGNVNTTGNVTGNVFLIRRDASVGTPLFRFEDTDTTLSDGTVLGAIEWYTGDLTPGARVTSAIKSTANSVLGNALVQIFTSTSGAAATAKVTVDSVGNVGVANIAPLHTFAVSGNTFVSGNASVIGNVSTGNILNSGLASVTGNITGGNLITGGLVTVTGNITGANVISTGAVSAGALGISATGNVTGGNVNSNGVVCAVGNITNNGTINAGSGFSTVANVVTGNTTVSGITTTSTLTVNTLSGGRGIGAENIVWQNTTATMTAATMSNVGGLGFFVLAGQSYKFEAYLPILPTGSTTTAFSTYFDAGICYYTVEAQATQTGVFGLSTSNVSAAATATQSMTGVTPRAARITGTIQSSVSNSNVTIQAQTSSADLQVQSGAYLTYTRIG
jgi:hypothetical protein